MKLNLNSEVHQEIVILGGAAGTLNDGGEWANIDLLAPRNGVNGMQIAGFRASKSTCTHEFIRSIQQLDFPLRALVKGESRVKKDDKGAAVQSVHITELVKPLPLMGEPEPKGAK